MTDKEIFRKPPDGCFVSMGTNLSELGYYMKHVGEVIVKEISALMEHEHLLVQQYEKEKQELIEEFLPIIEAGINTAIRMLSHSEKSRKHELHNEIEDLIDENMNALKLYLENYKKKWEERK